MEIRTLVGILDEPHLAAEQLSGWGLRDVSQGRKVLRELADSGLSLDLLAAVCTQLGDWLPQTVDPDEALLGLGRYFFAVRSPMALAALIERDEAVLPTLLTALSLAPYFTEVLLGDPDAADLLGHGGAKVFSRAELLADLTAETAALGDERSITTALARYRLRQLLRIAVQEATGRFTREQATEQITVLVETFVEAALAAVKPPPGLCVLAIGDLGAQACDYRHELSLLVVYEPRQALASSDLAPVIDRTTRHFQRLLAEAIGEGGSVELLALPEGTPNTVAHTADDVVHGFDSFGRTWHRQQMLKARVVAGERALGERVRERLEPWLFRRYLHRADETGIQALKRRILVNAALHQDDWRDLRAGRGGINDLVATIELMQLVVGHEQPVVRGPQSLVALAGLAAARMVNSEDHAQLRTSYGEFVELHHRLQIFVGPLASELPDNPALARQIYATTSWAAKGGDCGAELRSSLDRCWSIIHKLLTAVFPEAEPTAREVELLLDPAPPLYEVRAALAPFGFRDPEQARHELNLLATEQIPFLSTRRCRHLLAEILPRLLCAIAATPDPDRTLVHLARVSNSLGGKAVLWDLFRTNPATLDLYAKLCAASPYLEDILTTNPGMIDELVDSLQLDRLPTSDELQRTLAELSRGASDTLPVLHDLKNAAHLRIGVRDILGKEDVDATHAALADVAQTCLAHVAQREYDRLVEKHGPPTVGLGPLAGKPARMVVVGLGKLGGREPNYHSHLDILLLYEADGTTRPARPSRRGDATANNHFFTRFAQQTMKQLSELTAKGRLYTVEVPLRPIGIGGALAMTFDEFAHHFQGGGAPLWQWQALTQARPVFGEAEAQAQASQMLQGLLTQRSWSGTEFTELRRARTILEQDAGELNLKRGRGGTLDVEFLVQVLVLKYAAKWPEVLVPNTQAALATLGAVGAVDATIAEQLGTGYRFLRRVESGLRLLNTSARHDLPEDAVPLAQLALLLGHSNPGRLRERCVQWMAEIRAIFEQLTADG